MGPSSGVLRPSLRSWSSSSSSFICPNSRLCLRRERGRLRAPARFLLHLLPFRLPDFALQCRPPPRVHPSTHRGGGVDRPANTCAFLSHDQSRDGMYTLKQSQRGSQFPCDQSNPFYSAFFRICFRVSTRVGNYLACWGHIGF